jgi:hypothetical protein
MKSNPLPCAAEGCTGTFTEKDLLVYGELLCEKCRADIQRCPPVNKIVGRTVLAPCNLDKGPWWDEKHKYCTGSMHEGPGKLIICTCPCHTKEAA